MDRFQLVKIIGFFLLISILSSCEVIKGIFNTGMGVGIFISVGLVIVILVAVGIIRRGRK